MGQQTRTFTKTEFGHVFTARAYTVDGWVWKWEWNDAVVPLDAARDYGIPVDPTRQAAARDQETATFIRAYRKAQRGRRMSAEERFEATAAFGRGTTVVNVLTGRRTRL